MAGKFIVLIDKLDQSICEQGDEKVIDLMKKVQLY